MCESERSDRCIPEQSGLYVSKICLAMNVLNPVYCKDRSSSAWFCAVMVYNFNYFL